MICQRAAGIVQIGDDNQFRPRRNSAGDCFGIEAKTVCKAAREALHLRAEITCGGQQQLIGGMLDQDIISGRKCRGYGKMIGH